MSKRRVELLVSIIWTNCHEHALVNTFDAMGDAALPMVVEEMGADCGRGCTFSLPLPLPLPAAPSPS